MIVTDRGMYNLGYVEKIEDKKKITKLSQIIIFIYYITYKYAIYIIYKYF